MLLNAFLCDCLFFGYLKVVLYYMNKNVYFIAKSENSIEKWKEGYSDSCNGILQNTQVKINIHTWNPFVE